MTEIAFLQLNQELRTTFDKGVLTECGRTWSGIEQSMKQHPSRPIGRKATAQSTRPGLWAVAQEQANVISLLQKKSIRGDLS